MKAKCILFQCLLVALLLVSCGTSQRHHIQVGKVEPVHVARFDSLVYDYVQESDSVERIAMMEEAGSFWKIYNARLMRFKNMPFFYEELVRFMNLPSVNKLYNDALNEYQDMSEIENSLAQISARYQKLFSQDKTFVFQSHISALQIPIIAVDSLISISIDCYLGADYELYATRYRQYEMIAHDRSCLLPDVAEVMARNAIPAQQGGLLEAMVYEGVVMHLMAGLLDDVSMATLMRYTPEQEAWCIEHEEDIWCSIIEQEHLFTRDAMTIYKYISPTPFTATLSQDAPARVGRWVGWRIVEKYMDKRGFTLNDLAADNTPYTEVLRLSNYNGK